MKFSGKVCGVTTGLPDSVLGQFGLAGQGQFVSSHSYFSVHKLVTTDELSTT